MRQDDPLRQHVREVSEKLFSDMQFNDRLKNKVYKRLNLPKRGRLFQMKFGLVAAAFVLLLGISIDAGVHKGYLSKLRQQPASQSSTMAQALPKAAENRSTGSSLSAINGPASSAGVDGSYQLSRQGLFTQEDAISRAGFENRGFPRYPGKVNGIIHGGGPAPGIEVPGELETAVTSSGTQAGQPVYFVTFTETWNAKDFHYAGETGPILKHYWTYRVTQDGTVLVDQGGDFPPQQVM